MDAYLSRFTLDNYDLEIPSDILYQLPPTYKSALLSMLERYHNSPNFVEKLAILQTFGRKFVLLSDICNKIKLIEVRIENFYRDHFRLYNVVSPVIPKSMSSRYQKILGFHSKTYDNHEKICLRWGWRDKYWDIFLDLFCRRWNNMFYYPEKLLSIPHFNLDCTKNDLDANCAKPLSKAALQKYTRTSFLYEQFIRDDISIEEFILYLNEIEDDEVIIGLFEYRLGLKNGCLNKTFWIHYMDIMKDKDQIAYLNIYRRYTRFFVEDKEMVEKYRNEIGRISKIPIPVSEFWIDTILYEFDFGTIDSTLKALKQALDSQFSVDLLNVEIHEFPSLLIKNFDLLKTADSDVVPKSDEINIPIPQISPITCFYPRDQIPTLKKTQNFSIPRNIIIYLAQNEKASHQILQKLFNLCKLFFAFQPTPLCHRLFLGWHESSKYIGQSLFLNDKDLNFPGLDNLYITSTLDVKSHQPKALSNALPRFYKCEARFGIIENQEIKEDQCKYINQYPKGYMMALGLNIV